MPNKENTEKHKRKTDKKSGRVWRTGRRFNQWCVRVKFWQKFGISLVIFIVLVTSFMYGIARWYIGSLADQKLEYGATFIPSYARYYDLDPKETMTAMSEDLGIKRFRLTSYWDEIESQQGTYNFDELDWQMELAEQHDADVTLSIGLRQPRWPECHMPSWAEKLSGDDWREHLYDFMTAVVTRYKDHPALISYQLENEFFLESFGLCHDFDRARLEHEFAMVKSLDSDTPVIISRSNNLVPSWPVGEPRADLVGAAVYKRVYDQITQRYYEFPIPAWYYAFLGGMTKLTTDRDLFIHELQAEPWIAPNMGGIKDVSLEEQYKTMSPERLPSRLDYAEATGMRTIDLWGVEWWYWLKTQKNAPEMWDTAKSELQ